MRRIPSTLNSNKKQPRPSLMSSSTLSPAHTIRIPRSIQKRNCLKLKIKFPRHFQTILNTAAILDTLTVLEESQSSPLRKRMRITLSTTTRATDQVMKQPWTCQKLKLPKPQRFHCSSVQVAHTSFSKTYINPKRNNEMFDQAGCK